jgi:hypothetical protein
VDATPPGTVSVLTPADWGAGAGRAPRSRATARTIGTAKTAASLISCGGSSPAGSGPAADVLAMNPT